MPSATIDADFATDILAELYTYPRRRAWVAWTLWLSLGWLGAHRFYLGRNWTGLLMAFTFGGGIIWWFVDLFLVAGMLREYNDDQAMREREGLPPRELDFMPPLWRHSLERTPQWTAVWHAASRTRRIMRFAGDLLVLLISGSVLGWVAADQGVWEAVAAVLVLVVFAAAGGTLGAWSHMPVVHGLYRWAHRLRLFYYYNAPGSPLALLMRPITAALSAPFRRRDRAEVRLYLQLGGIFTALFLLLDFGSEVLFPLVTAAQVPAVGDVVGLWVREAVVTFVVIYAFATPIGAVLNRWVLVRETHTVPRLLSAFVLFAVLMGMLP